MISTEEKERWNGIVRSFKNWDVYFLCEYAMALQLHGDGTPLLIYFEDDEDRFCYAVMQKDISLDPKFQGLLESGRFHDHETPYGYGGPLCDKSVSDKGQARFLNEMTEYSKAHGIVSQFIRFHPLLLNHEAMPLVFETRYLHQTVFIDTASPELILSNMDSKKRNMIRKAAKSGVTIERRSIDGYQDFLPIYEETMSKNHADGYYFFQEDYFKAQIELNDYACIFYAIKDRRPIAGAMMYFSDRYMHYHLAGTRTEFRRYAPGDLLLYEAACWASERGVKQFHLGGGIAEDDELFAFKKKFNESGKLPFYIGRVIFDENAYRQLIRLRSKTDKTFHENNNRMIQYRA